MRQRDTTAASPVTSEGRVVKVMLMDGLGLSALRAKKWGGIEDGFSRSPCVEKYFYMHAPRVELGTSRLLNGCSNQLSYECISLSNRNRTSDLGISDGLRYYSPPLYQLSYREVAIDVIIYH